MENKLSPELNEKLNALKAKVRDGQELTLDDLSAVAGGTAGSGRSAEEDFYYLQKVYKEFGPVTGRALAEYMYGKALVDSVYQYMPYDQFGDNTLREIVFKVYNVRVGGGSGGSW